MRVPTNSNSDQMLDRISMLSSRQAKMQTQVATGQRIFLPEDDPAAMGRLLTLDNEKRQLTQFETNASYALDISKATSSALGELKKISDRAGELATLGMGSITTETYQSYASELNQLIEQGMQVANSKLRNDYLFAGTKLSTPAYTRTPATGDMTSATYNGDLNQVTVPITENSSISPGSSPTTNQAIGDFLNHLVELREAFTAKDPDAVTTARDKIVGTDTLSGDENTILAAMSEQGAVQTRIEISKSQRTERLDNIDKLVSNEADVDLPETITKLNQASLAYQAALQSASQIMKISLLDYLR